MTFQFAEFGSQRSHLLQYIRYWARIPSRDHKFKFEVSGDEHYLVIAFEPIDAGCLCSRDVALITVR
ncbi:MAG: hypothetical protein EA415_02450 [Sphaerobacteraceae bacterium]|nr:MAG: hypothetical protein EA415_02450 [Sphaerobacteraceae bacterium]